MNVEDIAAITNMSPEHEQNMLTVVGKGYRAARRKNSDNPYKQANFREAWQFGHDRCEPTVELEEIETAWLEHRRKEGERLAELLGRTHTMPAPRPVMTAQRSSSNVAPFPIQRCLYHLAIKRAFIAAQPAAKRQEYLYHLIEEHRQFLDNAGVEPGLVARECRSLELALNPQPTPTGGMRLAA